MTARKKKEQNTDDPVEAQESTGAETGDDSDGVVELAKSDVQELQAKAAEAEEWKSKYMYAAAEAENTRKRATRERGELNRYGGQPVLYELLEVIDNFERAIETDKKETDPHVIVEGIEMIYAQLCRLLERFDVKPVAAKGEKFDPQVHEAIQHLPSKEEEPDTVIEELQRGYTFRDRVLRPARVVVAAPAENDESN